MVEFQPRTVAIRALGSVPLSLGFLILCPSLPCYLPVVCLGLLLIRPPPHSIPLHLTRSIPETPPLLPSPRSIKLPTPPLTPSPILSLTPPPVSLPHPGLFRTDTTTAKKPSLPATEWPAHIAPELVALQYIVQPCSASVLSTSISPLFPLLPLPPPEAGNPSSHPSSAAAASR